MGDFDFAIDADDEIFFGLPEDGEDVVEVDCVWEVDVQEESDNQPSTSSSTASESTKCRPSKTPSASKSSKKGRKSKDSTDRLPCSHCNKTYANERTLKTHQNSVRLKDMARRAPSLSGLVEAMPNLINLSLNGCKNKFRVGDLAFRCINYINIILAFLSNCVPELPLFNFLASELTAAYRFSDLVFLSSLRSRVITQTNKLLNNEDFINELKKELLQMGQFTESDLNYFIGVLIMDLSEHVLRYACDEMMNSEAPYSGHKKRSKDDFNSMKFARLVHYIGGSVIAGVRRRRRNYPKSTKILNFYTIMESNFLENEDDLSSLCDPEVKAWTSIQDRGGLADVSMNAYNFFHKIISYAMCFEESDGSLFIEKVITAVSGHTEILELWDGLVGGLLDEDSSLEWLAAIVEIICRCISKGIIRRRLNEALKKPTSNVAHRPKLARN